MHVRYGRFDIMVNFDAGFVTISSGRHTKQCDRVELESWIEFYRRHDTGKSGGFYGPTLAAFEYAARVLNSDGVTA